MTHQLKEQKKTDTMTEYLWQWCHGKYQIWKT